jgi:hypothetical protein
VTTTVFKVEAAAAGARTSLALAVDDSAVASSSAADAVRRGGWKMGFGNCR